MQIEVFSLCDAALHTSGKLNILGVFDSITVRGLPAKHPHCAIALRIRFTTVEAGAHKVRITMVDEDGKSIVEKPIEGNIEAKFGENTRWVTSDLVFNMQNMQFPKEGQYSIDLAIDGRQQASLPISVRVPT